MQSVHDNMPQEVPYKLLFNSNMVGLFTCVFIKSSLQSHIRSVDSSEVKRGMGGLHGNKVAYSAPHAANFPDNLI